jgi:hypothetical protein
MGGLGIDLWCEGMLYYSEVSSELLESIEGSGPSV